MTLKSRNLRSLQRKGVNGFRHTVLCCLGILLGLNVGAQDLKKAIRQPEGVYNLDLSNQYITKEFPKIDRISQLSTLTLANNLIDTLPSQLGNLPHLTKFHSEGNPLRYFPPEFAGLQRLMYLELFDTKLDHFPGCFVDLGNLRQLVWVRNEDTLRLPDTLTAWAQLKVLVIDETPVDTLPNQLFELPNLIAIAITKAGLNHLPQNTGNLKSLKELKLDDNALTSLPRSFTRLTNLEYLSLQNNKIESLSENIIMLKKLHTLDLRGNPIEAQHIDLLKALLPKVRLLHD